MYGYVHTVQYRYGIRSGLSHLPTNPSPNSSSHLFYFESIGVTIYLDANPWNGRDFCHINTHMWVRYTMNLPVNLVYYGAGVVPSMMAEFLLLSSESLFLFLDRLKRHKIFLIAPTITTIIAPSDRRRRV